MSPETRKKKSGYLPVDVAKLVLTQSTLQANSDVEGSTGGNSTSNTRHCDNRDVLHLNVGRGLGNKHETLIQEVQKTLVGLDRTLDALVTVVAMGMLAMGHGGVAKNRLAVTDLEKSLEGIMTFFPDRPRKTLVTTWWIGSS